MRFSRLGYVPSPIPKRTRRVYMAGAGLASAFGMPNTPALLTELRRLANRNAGAWLKEDGLPDQLAAAFDFFYPDAHHEGFQPDVVNFFSTLRTYLDIGAGLAGTGLKNAPEMYRLLKRGTACLLVDRLRNVGSQRLRDHEYLDEMVQPGHIIITSNWDLLVETFCRAKGLPLRRASINRKFDEGEVTLLKLHGSIDWCQVSAREAGYGDEEFAALRELQFASPYRMALPTDQDSIVRIREAPLNQAWQKIKSRSAEPYLVTMATGKSDDLGPLRDVWRDAYRALSWARHIEVVGYSMPPDDVEIRTLLRTGIRRGNSTPTVHVVNPAPDVHVRVRTYLLRTARSSYLPVPPA
jgi:hypothetical protein